jgi:fructose-specific phosphotransferase system IIA component
MKANVIIPEMLFVNQGFNNEDAVLRFLAEQAVSKGRANNPEKLIQGFYNREKEFSTAVNNYIAIPHCRDENVKKATVAVIQNNTMVKWTAGEECNLFFALMIPAENQNQIHIRILAKLAGMIMEDQFVENIRKCKSSTEMYKVLEPLNSIEE